MSKEFLIRFSRLLTIAMGVLSVLVFLIGSNENVHYSIGMFGFFLLWTSPLTVPFVFNWLVFEKLQFWISKTNSENEYKFIERLSGVVGVFVVILWVAIVNENELYRLHALGRNDPIHLLSSFFLFVIPVVYNYLFLGKLKYWIYDRSFFEILRSQTLKKLIFGE